MKLSLKFKGIEPILTIYNKKDNWEKTHVINAFYPFRRLKWKIECRAKKKYLKKLGVKPYQCEGCGDGWAEWAIEEPNEPYGTHQKIFVCEGCVGFYDYKCTRKRLYSQPVDWRDMSGDKEIAIEKLRREKMGVKEDVVDRLLDRRVVKVENITYRIEKDKTLVLNSIKDILVKRFQELRRNGKKL